MRRVVLVALLAPAFAGCGGNASQLSSTAAARPQRAELGWSESTGAPAARIVFGVRSFEVVAGGWRAEVSVTNGTAVGFRPGGAPGTPQQQFGLMLFPTGDHRELDRRNAAGSLPEVRHAARYEPAPPNVLQPGRTWSAAISAPGPLVAGSWVRLVFGPLVPVGEMPKSLRDQGIGDALVWITDHAYALRP